MTGSITVDVPLSTTSADSLNDRDNAAASVGFAIHVADKTARDLLLAYQDQLDQANKIMGFYTTATKYQNDANTDAKKLSDVITFLNNNGYSYHTSGTYTKADIGIMLNDLSALKENATNQSQDAQAKLQVASNNLQQLFNLSADLDQLFSKQVKDIQRNW